MEKLKQNSALSKAAKKAEKKASKEAKKEKKRAASQMEAALAADGVGPPVIDPHASARRHADSDLPYRRHDPDYPHRHASAARHDQPYPRGRRDEPGDRRDQYRDNRDDARHRYREDSSHVHKQRRLHSPERLQETDRHGDRHARSDRDQHSKHHNGHAAGRDSHKDSARAFVEGGGRLDGTGPDSRTGTKYGLFWGETAPEGLHARDRYHMLPCTITKGCIAAYIDTCCGIHEALQTCIYLAAASMHVFQCVQSQECFHSIAASM